MATELSTAVGEVRTAALRSIQIMAAGSRADFDAVVHPNAVNREDRAEPPECRGQGPGAFYATALWLRAAFADLQHEIRHVVCDGDLVVVDAVMSGRHVAPFVVYGEDARIEQVWAPTGKTFAVTQSHWLRVRDGQVIEHWANRDDLGQGAQLGWVPPSPAYLIRCALAKRRARRAARATA